MRVRANYFTFALVLSVVHATSCPSQCVSIAGLDGNESFAFETLESVQFTRFVNPLVANSDLLGVTAQFQRVAKAAEILYSIASAYDEKALDFFGRAPVRFLPCCNAGREELLEVHRRVALIFWGIHLIRIAYGTRAGVAEVQEIVRSTGLDPSLVDVTTNVSFPWGFAKWVVDEHVRFFESDGWNELGSDTRSFNLRPYEDIVGYNPQPQPGNPNRWQPLVSDDGFGTFSTQTHVTPHIGFTSRVYSVTEEYLGRRAPPPNYNYTEELNLLLRRSRRLTRLPMRQALVAAYENKFFSVIPLLIQFAFTAAPAQYSQNILFFSAYVMAFDIAALDATTLVWREKVFYDAVRPITRLVLERGGAFRVVAGAGPGMGVAAMPAREFDSFIPTQAHSGYPSGSACLCKAMTDVMVTLNDGRDEVAGPPLEFVVAAGGIAPGLPERDVSVRYTRLSRIVRDCAQSRLDGGMHFTKSVEASVDLCAGIGHSAVEKALKLIAGDPSGRFADYEDRSPIRRRLPR